MNPLQKLQVLAFVATLLTTCMEAKAEQECFSDGDAISLTGMASSRQLKMANNSTRKIWVLDINEPLCVISPSEDGSINTKSSVSRFQVVGTPPPADTPIELTGKLSLGNNTQYYGESAAIIVKKGRRIAEQHTSADDTQRYHNATKELSYCVIPKIQYGQYSSYDGGKSALTLLGECREQADAWVETCITHNSQPRSTCNLEAGILVQEALKSAGK